MLTTITVILVILKLTAVINWSWFIVLLPTIVEGGGALIGLCIMGVVALAACRR